MSTLRFRNCLLILALLWAVPAEAQSVQRVPGALAYTVDPQTCADSGDGSASALTIAVLGNSYVAVTQSDAHGCALTLSETGAQDGQVLVVVNVSANSASFADSSGVQEMTGGTTVTLAQWASAGFVYRSDRWVAAGGGGGATLCSDDEIQVSNGAVYQCKDIPDCNTITEKLLYDDSANTFSCQTDQTASGAGSGNVTGPAGATDEALARYDTTTGELIQDSSITLSNGGLLTFPDGVTQVFNPDGTNAGINVGSLSGDPSSADNGDVWYDSGSNELTARINGSNVALGAGGGGGLVLVEQHTASSSATLDFTTCISSTYDDYLITLVNVKPATDGQSLYLRISADGGSSWISTSTYYYNWMYDALGSTSVTAVNGEGQAQVLVINSVVNNLEGVGGTVRLLAPGSAVRKAGMIDAYAPQAATVIRNSGFFLNTDTSAYNGVRFYFSSGNIASGTIRCYGLVK